MMSVSWGRPLKGEIGTKRIDIRLRKDLKESLDKIEKGSRTAFIEKVLEPALKSLDPKEPCQVVCKLPSIISEAENRAINSIQEGRFDDAIGFIHVAKDLTEAVLPYLKLCACENGLKKS
jgi:primosomal replication protein N